jgi:hypothetical protein
MASGTDDLHTVEISDGLCNGKGAFTSCIYMVI